jgi:daunorubicin resistance ABC transporter ATP-binding subunit
VPFAIEVEDLEKTFKGDVRALSGVTFSVEEGTVFGLLGPNGAGKTTVVRILTTILQPDKGVARVLGHDVMRQPDVVRSLFGLAGQYAAVDENLTGRENLTMVGRLNNMPRSSSSSRATELLREFDLVDASDRVLKTYSGGMRRRLDVAAALVTRPQVLFLDEPTTGLDPKSRNDLWDVIEQLVAAGTTVLLTTQYLDEADRLAERIAVVDHGQVISQGTPTELKANFGDSVLELGFASDGDAASAIGPLTALGGHTAHLLGTTVEMTLEGGAANVISALRALDEAALSPTTFAVREPSLDDVFLSLTGHQAVAIEPVADPIAAATSKRQRRGRRDQ